LLSSLVLKFVMTLERAVADLAQGSTTGLISTVSEARDH
jgi:hypothetical protein